MQKHRIPQHGWQSIKMADLNLSFVFAFIDVGDEESIFCNLRSIDVELEQLGNKLSTRCVLFFQMLCHSKYAAVLKELC